MELQKMEEVLATILPPQTDIAYLLALLMEEEDLLTLLRCETISRLLLVSSKCLRSSREGRRD